ncbi:Putative two-component response regulator [hydrothermal vent metagenome]|uniref:Putative two-component response regulator n=1 Tax=hydrothermal vent metagenome TaxID=652676 RepID=A0A1W1CWJ6_9ZZZZ
MVNSKHNNYFQNYFREVYLAKDNSDVLDIYSQKYPSVIFVNCHEEKMRGLDAVKAIRQFDKEAIIALLTDKIEKEELLESFGLNLIACLVEPFQKNEIQKLLSRIDSELTPASKEAILLKNRCCFNSQTKDFFNTERKKIGLTKYETLLIEILLKHKDQWVDNETIGYHIWEDEFYEKNCTGRLKTLINTLRKKIPKDTILNSYGMGYKIEVLHFYPSKKDG